jgi:hypothetical protein
MTADTGKPRYFNVKDYGAAGDGITDDTASFQAAIAEAMYDHGRWERPGPPPPVLEWTVVSSSWHHPRPLCIDGREYARRQAARKQRR